MLEKLNGNVVKPAGITFCSEMKQSQEHYHMAITIMQNNMEIGRMPKYGKTRFWQIQIYEKMKKE